MLIRKLPHNPSQAATDTVRTAHLNSEPQAALQCTVNNDNESVALAMWRTLSCCRFSNADVLRSDQDRENLISRFQKDAGYADVVDVDVDVDKNDEDDW